MKQLITALLLASTIFCTHALAQEDSKPDAFEMNNRLGMGINLGNTFEAPKLGAWGVDVDAFYFEEIKEKGFASIRIPARWSAHALEEAPYTIDKKFMDTIQWAVDLALEKELVVVLDVHHYEEMMEEPEAHKDRFLAFWEQISETFADYSDSLYFELFNEPNTNFTADLWNDYLKEAIAVVREKHPNRMVIIGAAEWGGIEGMKKLVLPENDNRIILTVHYYNPFNFTHQGADWQTPIPPTGVTWDSTAAQIRAIANDMAAIKKYSDDNNIPVYVGEFGAIDHADDASRARWIGHLREVFKENGFSAAYWEYCSGFGIYMPALNCYRSGMLQALTGFEADCDCAQFDTVIVKNSTFDRSINPWTFNEKPAENALANIAAIDGEARIEIESNGTESWHLQFLYASFPLKKDHTYTLKFDAYASEATTIAAMLGRNGGEWETPLYKNTALSTEKQTFTYVYTHSTTTIPNARVAFDFGLASAQYIYFDNVHVLEKAPEETAAPIASAEQLRIYPNPTKGELHIAGNSKPLQNITIYNSFGRIVQANINVLNGTIDLSQLPNGLYFVKINDKHLTVIKE